MSPLPWKVERHGVSDAKGQQVGMHDPENRPTIVRAVNAHEALVKALEHVGWLATVAEDESDKDRLYEILQEGKDTVEAALRLARVENK